jgi:chorismate mutase
MSRWQRGPSATFRWKVPVGGRAPSIGAQAFDGRHEGCGRRFACPGGFLIGVQVAIMDFVTHSVPFLVATLLSGLLALAPTATADPTDPLYELVDTAAQRLLTADPVAAFKWIKGGPIDDPARVARVLDAVGADATTRGVEERYVRWVFEDQIHATEGVEYTRFGQWKLDPASAPTVAPELSASRTAIDGFNHAMVNEIALQWNALRASACATELDDTLRAVGQARQLDPLYQHALAFATHSYCGETT